MIPDRFHFQTFAFFVSLLMSGVMSLTLLTLESMSILDAFVNWPKAWAISMLVAFPVSMIIVPITQKLVSRIVASK